MFKTTYSIFCRFIDVSLVNDNKNVILGDTKMIVCEKITTVEYIVH